jgi:hypothetical protein
VRFCGVGAAVDAWARTETHQDADDEPADVGFRTTETVKR